MEELTFCAQFCRHWATVRSIRSPQCELGDQRDQRHWLHTLRSSGRASPRRREKATEARCRVPTCPRQPNNCHQLHLHGAFETHGDVHAMYKVCCMPRQSTMRATDLLYGSAGVNDCIKCCCCLKGLHIANECTAGQSCSSLSHKCEETA